MNNYLSQLAQEKKQQEYELLKTKQDIKNIKKAFKNITEKKPWWKKLFS